MIYGSNAVPSRQATVPSVMRGSRVIASILPTTESDAAMKLQAKTAGAAGRTPSHSGTANSWQWRARDMVLEPDLPSSDMSHRSNEATSAVFAPGRARRLMSRDATSQGLAEIPQNRIFLRQGMTFCTLTPSVVSTVLGSCVAVSLWDNQLRVGGMNHYVLPHRMQELLSPRFGDVAVDQLLDGMARLGCRVASLQAKIYGGAEVLPFGPGGDTVGNQNVQVALELMRHHGIPILACHTGGHTGMLIRLYTATGDVLMRRLPAIHLAQADLLRDVVDPFSG